MLEKQRESLAASRNYQKVKAHLQRNKQVYITGVGCLVVGSVGMKLTNLASAPDVIQTIGGTDNVATVINRSKNVDVVIKYLNQRNYPANPVQCIETMEKWASQAEAALAKGISETNLSQHLNGKYPHANDLHFVRL